MFFVQGTLTKEDRKAWRKTAARWDRIIRRRRRTAVREGMAGGISLLVFGGLVLSAGVTGGMGAFWITGSLLSLAGGYFLASAARVDQRMPSRLPKDCFPPRKGGDIPVRAVFFGDGCFAFWGRRGKIRLGNRRIIASWEDESLFYLFLDSHPPLVLPKRGFVRRTPEEFRSFLKEELGRSCGYSIPSKHRAIL